MFTTEFMIYLIMFTALTTLLAFIHINRYTKDFSLSLFLATIIGIGYLSLNMTYYKTGEILKILQNTQVCTIGNKTEGESE